jgi:hypothetical protein
MEVVHRPVAATAMLWNGHEKDKTGLSSRRVPGPQKCTNRYLKDLSLSFNKFIA